MNKEVKRILSPGNNEKFNEFSVMGESGRSRGRMSLSMSEDCDSGILLIDNPIAFSVDVWEACIPTVGLRLTIKQIDSLLGLLLAAKNKTKV